LCLSRTYGEDPLLELLTHIEISVSQRAVTYAAEKATRVKILAV
jgi:hypothetical protein